MKDNTIHVSGINITKKTKERPTIVSFDTMSYGSNMFKAKGSDAINLSRMKKNMVIVTIYFKEIIAAYEGNITNSTPFYYGKSKTTDLSSGLIAMMIAIHRRNKKAQKENYRIIGEG